MASKLVPENAAFFLPEGDLMVATELTRGPWDAASQHAGPPAALIGREIERCPGIGERPEDRHVGRVTYEILAPVPIAPLRVSAEVTRPGRRVDMVEATLSTTGGEIVIRARGWRLLRREVPIPPGLSSAEPGSPAHDAGRPSAEPGSPTPPGELEDSEVFFPTGHEIGYHVAMDVRFDRGSFVEPGPAVAWMRARQPLVAGEELTPLQRVLVAADSGNGISSTLDFRRFRFINVDLTVHLARMPAGEWVCLDAVTVPEPHGAGISDTMLRDELGPLGRASQTLLIDER
ncbi:MAG: thioesterase family protein [Solirubrobacterales bacterium]